MTQVNELMAATVTVALLGEDGVASVPSSVEWRLKCIDSNRELQGWTAVTPAITYDDAGDPEESVATIALASALHAMQTSTKDVERKALCISADRGTATEWNDEIVYQVVRLYARS